MHACWRAFFIAALCIGLSFAVSSAVRASSDVEVLDPEVEYTFGSQITFRATIQSRTPIERVIPFLRVNGEPPMELNPVAPSSRGRVVSIYDASRGAIRAFSNVAYWYQVTLADGTTTTSPEFLFFYEDNRFLWQTSQDGIFKLHYYNTDPAFIDQVLKSAQDGLISALDYVPVMPPRTIDIYAYESAEDLQTSLRQLGDAQIAGHTDPALGIILVSLPRGPDQSTHIRQRIPHEIMHILTYQFVQEQYSALPVWLIEGLASMNELHPNLEYQVLLEGAHQNNRSLPLTSLCRGFPQDTSDSLLAYAQSTSFTRYLHHHYDTPGILNLLAKYDSTTTCEQGIEQAFSINLNRLENQWRRDTFGGISWYLSFQEMIPWVVLLATILAAPFALTIMNLIRKGENDAS